MRLIDFLLARIADDEVLASDTVQDVPWHTAADLVAFDREDRDFIARMSPSRVLVDCAGKRHVVEMCREVIENGNYPQRMRQGYLRILAHMAAAYSDHRDYPREWAEEWRYGTTMPRAECRCPDDCDCDGRFACEEQAGNTTYCCELPVGHDGLHRSHNHRWQGGAA